MSVSTVNATIARARQDNSISTSEIEQIIAASKRHVSDGEAAAFRSLREDIFVGAVDHAKDTGPGGVGAMLDLTLAASRARSLQSDMFETIIAPVVPAGLLLDSVEGKKGFFAGLLKAFAMLAVIASVAVAIVLLPVTALIGVGRNIYRNIID